MDIDTKMDDGMPGQGKVIGRRLSECTTSSSPHYNDYDAEYDLQSSSLACALAFKKAF